LEGAIKGKEAFVLFNNNGSFLPGCFYPSFIHQQFGLDIFTDHKTVEALLQHIKRCIRGVYLKVLLSLQVIYF
jgi:hypothetical protein